MTVQAFYFSPTQTTRQITLAVSEKLGKALGLATESQSLLKPAERAKNYVFSHEDILVVGLPVYGGRIPPVLEQTLKNMQGSSTPAVIIAVYGNRDFEDALLEMYDILTKNSFNVIGAAAFIGEHSFSRKLATGRPDGEDMAAAASFAAKCAQKIISKDYSKYAVKGNYPYKERNPAEPVAPQTTESCNRCMICFNGCPTQAINGLDPKIANKEKCIKCFACVKSCPLAAKYFDDELVSKAIIWLETNFMDRKPPEFFL